MAIPVAELVRIDLEIRRVHRALEKLRVVVGDATPRVGPRDSLRVARLKERLLGLRRDRARAAQAIARSGDAVSPPPLDSFH